MVTRFLVDLVHFSPRAVPRAHALSITKSPPPPLPRTKQAGIKPEHYDVTILSHCEFLDKMDEAVSNGQMSLVAPSGNVDKPRCIVPTLGVKVQLNTARNNNLSLTLQKQCYEIYGSILPTKETPENNVLRLAES